MTKLFWTLLGVMLTGAALLPTLVEARLASNHNETLLRDTGGQAG